MATLEDYSSYQTQLETALKRMNEAILAKDYEEAAYFSREITKYSVLITMWLEKTRG